VSSATVVRTTDESGVASATAFTDRNILARSTWNDIAIGNYCLADMCVRYLTCRCSQRCLAAGKEHDASPDVWGGMHVSLEMNAGELSWSSIAAHGPTAAIKVDAKGEFSVSGTYTTELGVLSKEQSSARTFLPLQSRVKATRCTWKSFLPTKSGCRIAHLDRGKTGRLVRFKKF